MIFRWNPFIWRSRGNLAEGIKYKTFAAAELGRPCEQRPRSPGAGPGSVAVFSSQGPDTTLGHLGNVFRAS